LETDNILNVFVDVCGNICFRGDKPEDRTDPVHETNMLNFNTYDGKSP